MTLLSAVAARSNGFLMFLSFLKVQFLNISQSDVFDILLLAVLIFFAIHFFRRQRAGKLVLGVGIWIFIMAIARIARLHALEYIMGYISQAGVIAIVIIFQPELRDALEKLGGEPLRGLKNLSDARHNDDKKSVIQDICEAVIDMARTKTGALIVIERDISVGHIVNSGVTVDAKISPYLIRNIFFNKSPLHDGAMVIRDMRIASAGCLLPLTRRVDVDLDLGTRHRAAIGMSEVCDAVVIVVSEETGAISIACDGDFTREYTNQTLNARLTQLLANVSAAPAEKKHAVSGMDEK